MRMNIFFGNLFWGILLILWGASMVLKTFNINMPLAKIFIAIIIILFGVKLLIGDKHKVVKGTGFTASGNSYYRSNSQGEYTMVFSGGTIDLMDVKPGAKDMEITVVFGTAQVILPSDLNFKIQPTTVFGATVLGEKNQFGIGEGRYAFGDTTDKPILIESTAVFGRLEYIFKERKKPTETIVPEDIPTDF